MHLCFVQYLQVECSKKDKEFGFAVDPRVQIRGHDVKGDPVEWIPCLEAEHMICPNNCKDCFLVIIDCALTEKLATLEVQDGVPRSDVTVIVGNSSMKRMSEDGHIKAFFQKRHPDLRVKLNFEMEGLEAPVVILIRNGGHLGAFISLGVSRATTKLIVISSEDNNIMNNAVREGIIKKEDMIKDPRGIYDHVKIPSDSEQARWSCIGSKLHSLHSSTVDYVHETMKNFLMSLER